MKKKLFYISLMMLILCALALWLLPLALGYLVQYRYHHMLGALSHATHSEIKIIDYKPHWFDSDVVLQVDLSHVMNFWHLPSDHHVKKSNPSSNRYLIVQKIIHGPIVRVHSADKKTRWLPGMALIETQPFKVNPTNPQVDTIHSLTLIRLTGSLLSGVTIPKLDYQNPQSGIFFQLQGLTASLDLSANLKQMSLQLQVPRIHFRNSEADQQLIGFSANYHLKRDKSGLFLGTTHHTIKQISWHSQQPQIGQFQIDGIEVTTESTEKNQRLDYHLKGKIQKIQINDADFGAQELDISLLGMDVPSLLALASEFKASSMNDQPFSFTMQRYQQPLDHLIKRGMEINLKKLLLSTAWGQPEVNGKIGWIKALPNQSLRQTLHANLQFYLPVALLNRVLTVFYQRFSTHLLLGNLIFGNPDIGITQTKEITQWVQHTIQLWRDRQWLIPKGDDGYQVHLEYQSGQLKINEQPIHLSH